MDLRRGGAVKTVVDDQLAGIVVGADPLAVPATHEAMLRACRNLGVPGVVACAISAVDVALWDLKARLLELPARRAARTGPRRGPDLRERGLHHLRRRDDPCPARAMGRRLGAPRGEDQDRRVVGPGARTGPAPGAPRPEGGRRRGGAVRRRQRGLYEEAGDPARPGDDRRRPGGLVRGAGLLRRPPRAAGGPGPVPGRRGGGGVRLLPQLLRADARRRRRSTASRPTPPGAGGTRPGSPSPTSLPPTASRSPGTALRTCMRWSPSG